MIIKEEVTINKAKLYKIYSNENRKILKIGTSEIDEVFYVPIWNKDRFEETWILTNTIAENNIDKQENK